MEKEKFASQDGSEKTVTKTISVNRKSSRGNNIFRFSIAAVAMLLGGVFLEINRAK